MTKSANRPPEPGQFVVVRNRHCVVEDVNPSGHLSDEVVHRVTLECLDDDRFGDKLDVIWEREVNCKILSNIGLPEKISWDPLSRFEAFIHSIMWSSVSLIKEQGITAPFRSAVDIEEYQMVPILRALNMPRANLLLADDVGLGKTIEAGLVAQELIARKLVQRIMVVCPASLQKQWQEEMFDKFGLSFEILNSDSIFNLRREYGLSVNPWAVYPRVITSMDFLKRSEHLQAFRASTQREAYSSALRDWDLLIVDEAHHVAPSGRKSYIRDSQRTKMMRSIVDSFENRLFLTATPHNGYSESFTALLELLDPLRFSRATDIDKTQLATIMIRRMKDEIRTSTGERVFPERIVRAIPVLNKKRSMEETEIADALEEYTRLRLSNPETDTIQVRFSLILLKKRFLSSPRSFAYSINVHCETVKKKEQEPDQALIEYLVDKIEEDFDDDVEKKQYEKEALLESSKFFNKLSSREHKLLETMLEKSSYIMNDLDGKALALLEWIEENLQEDHKWNDDRLIIFTEYLDTLHYLKDMLEKQGWGERLLFFYGGMESVKREEVKSTFQTPPNESPVRILIATDAASEGLNLQKHCRFLIHYEIPWNPNKLEQRNGRIDRHGQKARQVFVHHFVYENDDDTQFLDIIVQKLQTMRADIGSLGQVIAKQVEDSMLSEIKQDELDLTDSDHLKVKSSTDMRIDADLKSQITDIVQSMKLTKKGLGIEPATIRAVLNQALVLKRVPPLEKVKKPDMDMDLFTVKVLPSGWDDCHSMIRDADGRKLALTFEMDERVERKDIRVVHLNSPLILNAIRTFRKCLWTQDEMKRVSYKVIPDDDLARPVLVVFVRFVATSETGIRIHEEVLPMGGWIHEKNLIPIEDKLLAEALEVRGQHPKITKKLSSSFQKLYIHHRKQMMKLIEEKNKDIENEINHLLKNKSKEAVKKVKGLIQNRIKEIKKRLDELGVESGTYQTLMSHFTGEEKEQFDQDIRWLQLKSSDLKQRIPKEEERIKRRYTLSSFMSFPIGVLYLIPESEIEGEK